MGLMAPPMPTPLRRGRTYRLPPRVRAPLEKMRDDLRNPLLRRLAIEDLPPAVLSLDIETDETYVRRRVPRSTLAVAGIVPFIRAHKACYFPQEYESYGIADVDRLNRRLAEFDGLIVGFNILGFDYWVLEKYIDVQPLITKTLDLNLLAWEATEPGTALSLAALVQVNRLGRKALADVDIPALWKAGDHAAVLQRNRSDCELTGRLWEWMLRQGGFWAACRGYERWQVYWQSLMHPPHGALALVGQMAQMDHETWAYRLREYGNVRRHGPVFGRHTGIDLLGKNKELLAAYFRTDCEHCYERIVIRCARTLRARPPRDVPCPECPALLPEPKLLLMEHGWREHLPEPGKDRSVVYAELPDDKRARQLLWRTR